MGEIGRLCFTNSKATSKDILIRSTISPGTTEITQKIIRSSNLCCYARSTQTKVKDLHRYTKFYSINDWEPNSKWASKQYEKRMKKVGIKTKKCQHL